MRQPNKYARSATPCAPCPLYSPHERPISVSCPTTAATARNDTALNHTAKRPKSSADMARAASVNAAIDSRAPIALMHMTVMAVRVAPCPRRRRKITSNSTTMKIIGLAIKSAGAALRKY